MHNPIEVIHILNIIYNAFDTRLDRFDAYKVETINDSYLVASGLPEENETHARFTIYKNPPNPFFRAGFSFFHFVHSFFVNDTFRPFFSIVKFV